MALPSVFCVGAVQPSDTLTVLGALELLDELATELLELDALEVELEELPPADCSWQVLVAPEAGSANHEVLHLTPPDTAAIVTVVQRVSMPNRTVRVPVKSQRSPSLAQWVQVAAGVLELDVAELELLLDAKLVELLELLELAATNVATVRLESRHS